MRADGRGQRHALGAQLGDRSPLVLGPARRRLAAATRIADLPRLYAFATGLEKDWDAVVQGLSTRWNSGPVEGRVNHIKMIKRQMFGRAKLPLLRKRVLLTAAQSGHRHLLCP
ncbi:hypothetical protein ACWD0A_29180 [Streptomyces sp. NPDC002867]